MASLLGEYLINMKNDLEVEYNNLTNQLIPFDKVYDEDFLEAKEYQIMLISIEIDNLELELFMTFDSFLRVEMVRKIDTFTEKCQLLEEEIETLKKDRYEKHEAWKSKYLETSKRLCEVKTAVNVIDTFQTILELSRKKNKTVSKNVMTLCSLQCEFNNILKLCGHKKQGTPHKSFRTAYTHHLISEMTYNWLMA
jgi:hypothetical protein